MSKRDAADRFLERKAAAAKIKRQKRKDAARRHERKRQRKHNKLSHAMGIPCEACLEKTATPTTK